MKRFAVYPGFIDSASDGQEHYIDAPALMRLYGVNPAECVVVDQRRPETLHRHVEGLLPLYPCLHAEDYARIRDFIRRNF